jgi:quercetin dioxygenase-like cupin family protein
MKKWFAAALLTLLTTGSILALEAPGVQTVQLIRTTTSWDGGTLPAYPTGQPEVTILRITIPPGTRLPLHEHPVINAGVLLKGKLTVKTVKGETLRLEAGDPIVEVTGKWHYGVNEGDGPAEIVVFYAGVQDMPITLKEPAHH